MDLSQFINAGVRIPIEQFSKDENFKHEIRSASIIAAAYTSKLVNNRSYAQIQKTNFIGNHKNAWAKLVANLSNWAESFASLELPGSERIMVAAWHFAEIPTLFAYAKKINALILVSQDTPWLGDLKKSGCTLNISSQDALSQLTGDMQKGRIIGGVLDHYHPGMAFEETKFLGQSIRTPSAILDLCIRFKYTIVFVAPREGRIEIVNKIDASGRSAGELAQHYCDWLESEVKKSPEEWLMWQALPSARIKKPPEYCLQKI